MVWIPTTESEYEKCYSRYGGSFITHPYVIGSLTKLIGVEIKYFCCEKDGQIVACVPVWDDWIAGSEHYLKYIRKNIEEDKRKLFDLGYPEYILPMSKHFTGELPFRCEYISDVHSYQITNIRTNSFTRALAKKESTKSSAKSNESIRRKLKQFLGTGGKLRSITEYTISEIVHNYRILHYKRWSKPPRGESNLENVLHHYRSFLFGHVLCKNDQIVAQQIVYANLCSRNASFEYVNGGFDPDFSKYSLGSILYLLNTEKARDIAQKRKLNFRYSFGMNDEEYKSRWCEEVPCFHTNI